MQKQIETPKRAACRLDQLVTSIFPFGSSSRSYVDASASGQGLPYDRLRIEETRDIEAMNKG